MQSTNIEEATKIFKALADPTRLKIFLLLSQRTLCVNAMVNVLCVSQPAVSQHLRILREANLVHVEKRGYWAHYSVNKKTLKQFRRQFIRLLEGNASYTKKTNNLPT